MGEITINVEDGVEKEVAIAILGRATALHNSSANNESAALELRDVGQTLWEEHCEDEPAGWGGGDT